MKNLREGSKLDTHFGLVTVLWCKHGLIRVLIDNEEIASTFRLGEFMRDFVL